MDYIYGLEWRNRDVEQMIWMEDARERQPYQIVRIKLEALWKFLHICIARGMIIIIFGYQRLHFDTYYLLAYQHRMMWSDLQMTRLPKQQKIFRIIFETAIDSGRPIAWPSYALAHTQYFRPSKFCFFRYFSHWVLRKTGMA